VKPNSPASIFRPASGPSSAVIGTRNGLKSSSVSMNRLPSLFHSP
jgi:hypothetical protein